MQFLYFPMPAFYRYNFLIMKLQLTWYLPLDTEIHLDILETCLEICNIHFNSIIPSLSSASNHFYTQSCRLSIQLNSFSRIGTTIWNEMPLTLRSLSKYDFIKRVLFGILTWKDSYLDIRNIIRKLKFS